MTAGLLAGTTGMQDLLRQAGFTGVEAVDGVIYARLWSSSGEFTLRIEGAGWCLAVQWPVRATQAQIAQWNARQPHAPMDIFLGETRVTMRLTEGDAQALHLWAAVAEEMVAQCTRWRRSQRAPGEGM
jgi:hypothetical protein